MRKISSYILRLLDWSIEGEIPVGLKKYLLAVVPHTSNWDFPLGLLVRAKLGRSVQFIGKHTLFKPPHGFIFRWLGGYPVDRSKSTNYVDSVVNIFNQHETFAICLAPEGTRKKVDKLRTGFYFIAKKADIPIILVRFDYGTKVISFSEPFYTTDDTAADFEYIHDYFRGAVGKIPTNSFDPA